MQALLTRKPPRPALSPSRVPDWGAAGWAGLGAAFVFMGLEAVLRPALGRGPWMASQLVATLLLGEQVLEPPPEYAAVIAAAAIGVHLTLSLLYTRILVLLLFRWRMLWALEAGAAFGMALYLINFYALAAAFPWLALARSPVTALGHIAFGVTAAFLYKELERPEETT